MATKPIEQFELGDRTVGRNPQLSDEERNVPDPDPATWRAFTLRMDKPDGEQLKIKLLCPPEWSELHGASPGDTVQLDLEELRASGPARVVSAGTSPPIRPGPGQVVTGIFIHSSAEAMDLHLEGGETLGVTPTHPMWSEDRQDFVPAGTLQRDEHLLGRDGRRVRITDITPRAGPEPVYNLQVHGEHVYQVGSDGLLVHNSKVRAGGVPNRGARHYTDFADEAAEIMENAARSRGLNPNAGVRAMAAPIRDVDLSKLLPPPTRSVADPAKLQRLGPFDWSKYRPIQVEDLGGGRYVIMDGMTRVEAARRAGITKLPVQIFPKSGP